MLHSVACVSALGIVAEYHVVICLRRIARRLQPERPKTKKNEQKLAKSIYYCKLCTMKMLKGCLIVALIVLILVLALVYLLPVIYGAWLYQITNVNI